MANFTKAEAARLIVSFVDGSCGVWDWDDFTSARQDDPKVEAARLRLIDIHDEYPSGKSTVYCSPEGISIMLEIAESLRK